MGEQAKPSGPDLTRGVPVTSVKRGGRHDDCAAEMQTLDDAHDNLADAVADEKTCH